MISNEFLKFIEFWIQSYYRFLDELFSPYQETRDQVAKTKALISFAVTAKLICVFVFAYADCWFSHDAAQMKKQDFEIAKCVLRVKQCDYIPLDQTYAGHLLDLKVSDNIKF